MADTDPSAPLIRVSSDEQKPAKLGRQKSLNRMLASATLRRRGRGRSNTESEDDPSTKTQLSRQRSLTDLVSRLTFSFRSPSLRRHAEKTQYTSNAEDYEVCRLIGSGATAAVYSANHTPSQSLVAIKKVNLELLDKGHEDGTQRLEALRKEIQIMTLCRHPHLLPVYQSFVSQSHLHIIMPIMSAGSCHDLLLQQHYEGLEEPLVACIIKQVVLGLQYLHDNGLVHRDVKAANLLLDRDTGIVKLADFGVSNHLRVSLPAETEEPSYPSTIEDIIQLQPKLKPANESLSPFSSMQMLLPPLASAISSSDIPAVQVSPPSTLYLTIDTTPSTKGSNKNNSKLCVPNGGSDITPAPSCDSSFSRPNKNAARRSFVGTPCWMAPEILQNRDYNTQVDIWSLGVTAIELACGRPPYTEYDPLTIFSLIVHDPMPNLEICGCRYEYTNHFQSFLDQCLHKNPTARLSASEALQHPFLRKAQSPQLLMRHLQKCKRPDMTVCTSKRQDHAWGRRSPIPEQETLWNFTPRQSVALEDDEPDSASPMTPIEEWQGLPFQVALTKVGQHMRPIV